MNDIETTWDEVMHLYPNSLIAVYIRNKTYSVGDPPAKITRGKYIIAPHFVGMPVLKSLSDMTETDALNLHRLGVPFIPPSCRVSFNSVTKDDIALKVNRGTVRVQFDELNAHQFLYLLNQNFDLFGLIKKGMAVNEKLVMHEL